MVILIGVVVGYVLAYVPKMADFLISLRKPVEEKAREPTAQPTEAEVRKAEKAAKEYANFMTYDGTAQDDIID